LEIKKIMSVQSLQKATMVLTVTKGYDGTKMIWKDMMVRKDNTKAMAV